MFNNKSKGFFLYRFFYGDDIVYVGRTKQKINDRLRGHFFAKPMRKKININMISKIEVAELKSEADMFLYEIYYINYLKPPINRDDKAHDDLTVQLPEIEWLEHWPHLMDKWKSQIMSDDEIKEKRNRLYKEIPEERKHLRIIYRSGERTKDEIKEQIKQLDIEEKEIREELYG